MPQVLATFKVMPKDAEVDLSKMEEAVKSSVKPDRIEKEPIAFGLVALKISILIEDAEGQVDELEDKLKAIDSVGEIEVVKITRTI